MIQNGDEGSTSSRLGERDFSDGAFATIVRWRRRADLFNGNWFVDAVTVDHSLPHVSFDLGPRLRKNKEPLTRTSQENSFEYTTRSVLNLMQMMENYAFSLRFIYVKFRKINKLNNIILGISCQVSCQKCKSVNSTSSHVSRAIVFIEKLCFYIVVHKFYARKLITFAVRTVTIILIMI